MLRANQRRDCSAMGVQVISNRMNSLGLGRRARLGLSEKVPPVVSRASEVIFGQLTPSRQAKRVEEIAFPAAAIMLFSSGRGI